MGNTCPLSVYDESTIKYTVWKLSVFGVFLICIFPHSDWILLSISPYSVRMLEKTDQKNSEYEHFSHSGIAVIFLNWANTFHYNPSP